MYQIYKITNLVNGKLYIGQTKVGMRRRFRQHVTRNTNSPIHNAIVKYGEENFIIEELAICFTKEEANKTEILAIKIFNTFSPNGYNLHEGGLGGELDAVIKEKISKKAKERLKDPKNNPNYGKKMSEETKAKISKSKKGKKLSKEHKEKISIAFPGKNNPHYGKKAEDMPFGNRGGWNKGIPMSEESKQKRRLTKFHQAIDEILDRGLKVGLFNINEFNYMQNKLSDGHYDVIVGFFIGKVQDVKWGCKDRTREEKDELIKLNRKMKNLHFSNKKFKEVSR